MERRFIENFEGAKGKAEVFELDSEPEGRLGVHKVEYEVSFKGESHVVLTMGEASVLACELSGDPRFVSPSGNR